MTAAFPAPCNPHVISCSLARCWRSHIHGGIDSARDGRLMIADDDLWRRHTEFCTARTFRGEAKLVWAWPLIGMSSVEENKGMPRIRYFVGQVRLATCVGLHHGLLSSVLMIWCRGWQVVCCQEERSQLPSMRGSAQRFDLSAKVVYVGIEGLLDGFRLCRP